jgi:hypothetical protein
MTSRNRRSRRFDEVETYVAKAIQDRMRRGSRSPTGTQQGTTPGAGGTSEHETKDYVEAHKLNNRNGYFYSVNYGVVGGALVDESNNIITMLNAVGAQGGGTCIIRSRGGLDPIYINKTVSIYYSNVHVVFRSPVVYGASGSVRIMGSLDEFTSHPAPRALKLRANSYENASTQMVLPLFVGDGAYVNVGDKITVRGQNDASGKAIQKQTVVVVAKTGDDITCSEEMDFTFQPTYPLSEWPPDFTTGTTIYIVRYRAFTGAVAKGALTATVTPNTTGFAVGDTVLVSDSRTESDLNPSAVRQSGTPYQNAANMEIARIVAINTGTNEITFDHALRRGYATAFYGGISRLLPVENSVIRGINATWAAVQTSRNTHPISVNYGLDCRVENCKMNGAGFRLGNGIRVSYSYRTRIADCSVIDGTSFDSAEAYGITDYYSTQTRIDRCYAASCRHSYLLQATTDSTIADCWSVDDLISGFDTHGAFCVGTLMTNCRAIAGTRYSPGVSNRSGFRIGNTSHCGGDFDTVLIGCMAMGYLGSSSSGFDWIPASGSLTLKSCVAHDCTIGFRFTRNSSHITPTQTAKDITLEDCLALRCATMFDIDGASNGALDGLYLLGCQSQQNTNHFVVSDVTKLRLKNCAVLAPVASSGVYGYNLNNTDGVVMDGCLAHGANRGLYLINSTDAVIVNNVFTATIDVIPFTDGGGNTSLIYTNNAPVSGGGGGGSVIVTRVDGTLAASTTTSAIIPHDNSTPLDTEGFQCVSVSYTPGAAGRKLEIEGHIPYVSMAGATGAVSVALFLGTTCLDARTDRVTIGGASGSPLVASSVTTTGSGAVTIQLRIGVDVGTNTLTLRSKFGGLDQPFLIIREYP